MVNKKFTYHIKYFILLVFRETLLTPNCLSVIFTDKHIVQCNVYHAVSFNMAKPEVTQNDLK